MLPFLLVLAPLVSARSRARRRRQNIFNEISATSFPRTQQFPLFNPAFYAYVQSTEVLGSSTPHHAASRRRNTRRRQTKRKSVRAPAVIPAVAIPAEELHIDGLPPGMDHVVIDRPEVKFDQTITPIPPPSEPIATDSPTPTPTPTPTPYPVGVALGMAPVPGESE